MEDKIRNGNESRIMPEVMKLFYIASGCRHIEVSIVNSDWPCLFGVSAGYNLVHSFPSENLGMGDVEDWA